MAVGGTMSEERTVVIWSFENSRDFPWSRHSGPVPVDLQSRDIWDVEVALCEVKFERFMNKCEGYAHFSASKPIEHLRRMCFLVFDGMATRAEHAIHNPIVLRSLEDHELVDRAVVVFEFDLRNKKSFTDTTFDIFEELMGQLRPKVLIQDLPYPDIYRQTECLMGDDGGGPIHWSLGHVLFNNRYAHLA